MTPASCTPAVEQGWGAATAPLDFSPADFKPRQRKASSRSFVTDDCNYHLQRLLSLSIQLARFFIYPRPIQRVLPDCIAMQLARDPSPLSVGNFTFCISNPKTYKPALPYRAAANIPLSKWFKTMSATSGA
jgi:hypothetical protein